MEEAIKTLKQALELDAKLAPARALLGISYYEMGDVKNARETLTAALQLNPGDQEGRPVLGPLSLLISTITKVRFRC